MNKKVNKFWCIILMFLLMFIFVGCDNSTETISIGGGGVADENRPWYITCYLPSKAKIGDDVTIECEIAGNFSNEFLESKAYRKYDTLQFRVTSDYGYNSLLKEDVVKRVDVQPIVDWYYSKKDAGKASSYFEKEYPKMKLTIPQDMFICRTKGMISVWMEGEYEEEGVFSTMAWQTFFYTIKNNKVLIVYSLADLD